MIDVHLLRKNPEVLRENLRKRFMDEGILKRAIALDNLWRKRISEGNRLRKRRNELSIQIAELKKRNEGYSAVLSEAKRVDELIAENEREVKSLEEDLRRTLMEIPNVSHESVPIGRSEEDNVVVRVWGDVDKSKISKTHIDIALELDLMDLERASRAAGSRFYYLKNELVELNLALIKLGFDFLKKKGFELFLTPYMLRRSALEGGISFLDFEDMIYKIEGEDLYLIGTAEHALLAYHMGEILDGKRLPLRYAGITPCFRKEAGAHGKDTKGIFRVHQFEKVEQFVFTRPEDSYKIHEELIANAEEFYQLLGLPYRVVNICSGELGNMAAKRYDLEAWFSGQGRYREVVSCSNCTDYQARRSGIRFRDKPGEQPKFVHTLNSTLVATERTLVAILENYQCPDGTIKVPDALVPYVGFEYIYRKRT